MIKLNNVSFSYGSQKIISDLTAAFDDNTSYCIMGKSGIGKTTLLNIISGLLEPTAGTISGTESKKQSFIFQENRLLPWLNIYDNIKYVTDDEEKIKSALIKTNLYENRNSFPNELSGGMARRAAIARAEAFGGDIFFIDEPLYGLDLKTGENILSLIKNTIKDKMSFIITHSPEEAFFLADKIVFIDNSPFSKLTVKNISDFKNSESLRQFITE